MSVRTKSLVAVVPLLAAQWSVEPAVARHLVQAYAAESLVSMEAAVDELQGLSYDDVREQVGEV